MEHALQSDYMIVYLEILAFCFLVLSVIYFNVHRDLGTEQEVITFKWMLRVFMIALVADGLEQSFRNTMQEHGLSHVFAAWVVSEPLGVEKPDQRMFETAMQRLGLTEADKQRVIMVGNNLARDMVGANRFGIRSVHMDWSPRYPDTARVPEETPTYTVHSPDELLPLVECLERQLEEKQDA